MPFTSQKMTHFKTGRVSKFRHVYGQPAKREDCYEGLRITSSAHESLFCAVNPKFLAVVLEVAGGGAFQVLPLKWTGKVDYHTGRITGHGGKVNDLRWNPFNDNVIASCADDSTIKLWYIPDGGVRTMSSSWLSEMRGVARRQHYLEWHPTVEGVLASAASDFKIYFWNTSRSECFLHLDGHEDFIFSFAFDFMGIFLATTCKDRKLRLYDARTGQLLQESDEVLGSKCSIVTFLGQKTKILTTGLNKTSTRQLALWDRDNIKTPVITQDIDTSSGALFPLFDSDLNILYIVGKGDGNIRFYEISQEPPFLYYLSEFQSKFPQRGVGWMPKRGLDCRRCEICRFYKIHAGQQLVEPLSFIVPRKSERFQNDLYPPTPGPTPCLTFKEWLGGIFKKPILISLQPNFLPVTNKPAVVKMAFDDETETCRPTLITSDLNNERKFQFLSTVTKPDYRIISEREDYADLLKEQLQQPTPINVVKSTCTNQKSLDNAYSMTNKRPLSVILDEILTRSYSPPLPLSSSSSIAVEEMADMKQDDIKIVQCAVQNHEDKKSCKDPEDDDDNDDRDDFCQQEDEEDNENHPTKIFSTSDVHCQQLPESLYQACKNIDVSSTNRLAVSTFAHESDDDDDDDDGDDDDEDNDDCNSSAGHDHNKSHHTTQGDNQSGRTVSSSGNTGSSSASCSSAGNHGSSERTSVGDRSHVTRLVSSASVNFVDKRLPTKPGCIGRGPMAPKTPVPHLVRPFRICQTQPSTPKNFALPVTDNKGNITDGINPDEINAAQLRKISSDLPLITENHHRLIDQLQQDVVDLTKKLDFLHDDLKLKDDDIESLRYEIAWKDKRISQLEEQLLKRSA